ncbi:MAG TPA: pyridoxal-phosphate dependent enzyme [Chthoniobacterales bacterium]
MVTLDLSTIRAAHERITPFIRRTAILTNPLLDSDFGARFFFKCENLQVGGAFKARGAHNAIFSLSDDEVAHGVVTQSSGNHATAVALAASRRGVPAKIVMPSNTPKVKCDNVRNFGGEIIFCEPTLAAREATAAQVVAAKGGTLIHPYNDARVIAGQGTVALELLQEVPDLDVLLVPVSGGGLLGGCVIAAKSLRPEIQVMGVEPEQADDAFRSFRAGERLLDGRRDTIADGLRGSLGELNWSIIRDRVDDIVTVTERGIVDSMRVLWENLKLVVEPSGAVAFTAAREGKIAFSGKKIGVVISGGNVDLDRLPWQ